MEGIGRAEREEEKEGEGVEEGGEREEEGAGLHSLKGEREDF